MPIGFLGSMLIGAAIGGGTAKARGGNTSAVLRGAGYGAAGGAAGFGISSAFAGPGSQAAVQGGTQAGTQTAAEVAAQTAYQTGGWEGFMNAAWGPQGFGNTAASSVNFGGYTAGGTIPVSSGLTGQELAGGALMASTGYQLINAFVGQKGNIPTMGPRVTKETKELLGTRKTDRQGKTSVSSVARDELAAAEYGAIPNMAKPQIEVATKRAFQGFKALGAKTRASNVSPTGRYSSARSTQAAGGLLSAAVGNVEAAQGKSNMLSGLYIENYINKHTQTGNVVNIEKGGSMLQAQSKSLSRQAGMYQQAGIGSALGAIPRTMGMLSIAKGLYGK